MKLFPLFFFFHLDRFGQKAAFFTKWNKKGFLSLSNLATAMETIIPQKRIPMKKPSRKRKFIFIIHSNSGGGRNNDYNKQSTN